MIDPNDSSMSCKKTRANLQCQKPFSSEIPVQSPPIRSFRFFDTTVYYYLNVHICHTRTPCLSIQGNPPPPGLIPAMHPNATNVRHHGARILSVLPELNDRHAEYL